MTGTLLHVLAGTPPPCAGRATMAGTLLVLTGTPLCVLAEL